MNTLDQNYWDQRWKKGETGWDIGYESTPLCEYMKKYKNKEAQILIPGCGNAYEAAFLQKLGFNNIHLLDISPTACNVLITRFKSNAQIKVHCADFLNFKGKFDLILEQTFFCALDRNKRIHYVEKAHELLNPAGQLVGILFASQFEKEGPPFGGTSEEYKSLFSTKFGIKKLEFCYNSIEPRKGNELFILFEKLNISF